MNTFFKPNKQNLVHYYFNALSNEDQKYITEQLLSRSSLENLLIPLNDYFNTCGYGHTRIVPFDSSNDYFTHQELRIIPLPMDESQHFLVLDPQLFTANEEEIDLPESIHIGLALTNTNRIFLISGFIYKDRIDALIYDPTPILTDKNAKSLLLSNGLPYLMSLMPHYTAQVYELVHLIYKRCSQLSAQYLYEGYDDVEAIAIALNATSTHYEDEGITVAIDEFTKRGHYITLTAGQVTKRARLIHATLKPSDKNPNSFRIRSKVMLKDDFDLLIFKVYEPAPSNKVHYICLTNPHDFKPIEGSNSHALNPTIRFIRDEKENFEFAPKGISRIHDHLHYIPLCELAAFLKQ